MIDWKEHFSSDAEVGAISAQQAERIHADLLAVDWRRVSGFQSIRRGDNWIEIALYLTMPSDDRFLWDDAELEVFIDLTCEAWGGETFGSHPLSLGVGLFDEGDCTPIEEGHKVEFALEATAWLRAEIEHILSRAMGPERAPRPTQLSLFQEAPCST